MKATAAALFVVASVTAQAAEPATLTLACKGMATTDWYKTPKRDVEPASHGIIINFTARTVDGFGFSAEMTAADEATVSFDVTKNLGTHLLMLLGKLDRVTGDVEATSMFWDQKTQDLLSTTKYALKCRPAQRMF